jgi:capsular polysaccharide biosynthesis protein
MFPRVLENVDPREEYAFEAPPELRKYEIFTDREGEIIVDPSWLKLYKEGRAHTDATALHIDGSNQPTFNELIKPSSEIKRLEGEHIVWLADNSYNYSHFMFSTIGRLHLIEKHEIPLDSSVFIVENFDPHHPYTRTLIDQLGVSESNIHCLEENMELEFKYLWFTARPYTYPFSIPSWMLDYVDRKFELGEPDPENRLYVSRVDAERRRVVNEPEVTEMLKNDFGFKVATLSDESVAQQAMLFSTAGVIVSPHGAGNANTIFCRPETKFVELFHEQYINVMYYAMCQRRGLTYTALFDEEKVPLPPGEDFLPMEFAQGLNMEVDIEKLKATLSQMGL